MAVEVQSGWALVPGSESSTQAGYWVFNDSTITESVDTSHGSLPRIDIAVLQVRDAFYSGASNDWFIDVVTGTPASSPVAPTAPANSLILAEILVPAASSTVVNANITDKRDYLASTGGIQFGTNAVIGAYDLALFPEGQLFYAEDATSDALTIKDTPTTRVPVWYGDIGRSVYKYKTADETVNNVGTPQDDNHLFWSVVANAVYSVELWLHWVGVNTTADFLTDWSGPAGAQMVSSFFAQPNAASASAGDLDTGVAVLAAIGADHSRGTISGSLSGWHVGTITTSSTPGTATFRWSQNTAGATNLVLKQYSWGRLTRMA